MCVGVGVRVRRKSESSRGFLRAGRGVDGVGPQKDGGVKPSKNQETNDSGVSILYVKRS